MHAGAAFFSDSKLKTCQVCLGLVRLQFYKSKTQPKTWSLSAYSCVKRSSRNYECSDDSFSTAAFLVASVVYVDVVLKSGSLHDFFLGRGQLNLGGSPAPPPEDFLAWRQHASRVGRIFLHCVGLPFQLYIICIIYESCFLHLHVGALMLLSWSGRNLTWIFGTSSTNEMSVGDRRTTMLQPIVQREVLLALLHWVLWQK